MATRFSTPADRATGQPEGLPEPLLAERVSRGASRSAAWRRLLARLALSVLLCTLAHGASAALLVVSDRDNKTHEAVVSRIRDTVTAYARQGGAPEIERLDTRDAGNGVPEGLAPDLIVTVGAQAAAEINGKAKDVPVLNVLLPQAAHQQINDGGRQTAAIVLDQPIRRQLAVARALLPEAKRAGMLRGHAASSALPESPAAAFGLELHVTPIGEGGAPADAIQEVLRTNDVVVATFDPDAYTPATAKWLLYLAFQQRRPIVGFSYALLRAGAVAAVFSTPEQIGDHAADVVGEWLRTGLPPQGVDYPRYYHVGLNAPVARKLGIRVPGEDQLAERVYDLLGEVP